MYKWPVIDEELRLAVLAQLERSLSDVDSTGIFGEVEQEVRSYYGTNHSIFFSCATGAMHTLYFALGLRPGDNVIVPTYTFFATFSPFAYEGIEIRQADSDVYGNIDPEGIERLVDKKTRAVIVTHMWGIPGDLDKIAAICNSRNLILIEDCSHAHLATYNGQKVGTFGQVGIFSTNQKTLTSGEGGFLITNNREIFERSLCVAHYNKRIEQEVRDPVLRRASLTGIGLKYRGFTLGAAILLHQFGVIESIRKQRTINYEALAEAVAKSDAFENIDPPYNWTPGLYVFPFKADESDRESLLSLCYEKGFKYFDAPGSTKPLHDEPIFLGDKNIFHRLSGPATTLQYPKADSFHRSIIKLPLWGDGDGNQIEEEVAQYASFIKSL